MPSVPLPLCLFTLSWNLASRAGATCRSFSSSTTWGSCPSSEVDSVPSCSRLAGRTREVAAVSRTSEGSGTEGVGVGVGQS